MNIISKKYIIPLFNNKHNNPYGRITVLCSGKLYHRYFEINKKDNFIINHKKYKLVNMGSYYYPKLALINY